MVLMALSVALFGLPTLSLRQAFNILFLDVEASSVVAACALWKFASFQSMK